MALALAGWVKALRSVKVAPALARRLVMVTVQAKALRSVKVAPALATD
jgi:hypothetical protein